MTDQLSFADYKYGKPSIDDRFGAFHQANPEVFEEFRKLATMMLERGHTHYSADALLHVVRFHRHLETRGEGGYLINNDFSSRYARLLMAADARFDGFFELRKLRQGVA